MKLKSYLETNRTGLRYKVIVQKAATAAPAGYTVLGEINHEVPDNLRGMQALPINHVIFQHVQEQMYTQKGVQDMQSVLIDIGDDIKPVKSMYIEKSKLLVKPGEKITLKVIVDPVDALVDGYFCVAENETLAEVEDKTNGVFEITMPQVGQTLVKIGITNGNMFEWVPVEALEVERQA